MLKKRQPNGRADTKRCTGTRPWPVMASQHLGSASDRVWRKARLTELPGQAMSFGQRGSINRHLLALSLLQKRFSALLMLNHESKIIISYPVTGRQGERNDIFMLD